MTYAEASKCFRVSKETVKRIVKGAKQNSDSRDTPSKRKLSRSSLNGRACSIIVGLLQENSSITLRSIVATLLEAHQISTSISSVDRLLVRMGVTYKASTRIPETWNTPESVAQRKDFVTNILSLEHRQVVYMDESGFNLHIRRNYGRAPRGTQSGLSLSH